MSTSVYIDGFNLFNGAVKGSPYKWLDLGALCRKLLPGHTIGRIRYFTANVIGFAHNPQAPSRQQIYLRALETIPNLTVHKDGWFSSRAVLLPQSPLAYCRGQNKAPQSVQVQRMEEKRTDVDLATHLLDCFADDFDEAAVISNDSDLCLPIEMVRVRYGKSIHVINPHPPRRMSGQLAKVATHHIRTINNSVVRACQFPPVLTDSAGRSITKPPGW
jgi:uncharacterized LabA/DUF88 family protein